MDFNLYLRTINHSHTLKSSSQERVLFLFRVLYTCPISDISSHKKFTVRIVSPNPYMQLEGMNKMETSHCSFCKSLMAYECTKPEAAKVVQFSVFKLVFSLQGYKGPLMFDGDETNGMLNISLPAALHHFLLSCNTCYGNHACGICCGHHGFEQQ